jgi:hypothetical protein
MECIAVQCENKGVQMRNPSKACRINGRSRSIWGQLPSTTVESLKLITNRLALSVVVGDLQLLPRDIRFPACIRDTKMPKPDSMARFWFVWTERGIGSIHKNHSWNSDLSFWSRSPSKTGPFSVGCIARRERCLSCIGFFETSAMTPTCSTAIKWMKRRS